MVSILTSLLASLSVVVGLTAFLVGRRKMRVEEKRWRQFRAWMFPHLKKSEKLAEAYAEAKVEKEKSQARKVMEEAAEIAAKSELARQKALKEFGAMVDDVFADDKIPETVRALKLAKLIEKNPEVAAQLEKVKEIIEKLASTRGLSVEAVDDYNKELPEEAKETE